MHLREGRLLIRQQKMESEYLNIIVESGALQFQTYMGIGMMKKTFIPRPSMVRSMDLAYEGKRDEIAPLIPELEHNERPTKILAKILPHMAIGYDKMQGYTILTGKIVEHVGRPDRHGARDDADVQTFENGALVYREERDVLAPVAIADIITELRYLCAGLFHDDTWGSMLDSLIVAFLREKKERLGEATAEDLMSSDVVDEIQSFQRLVKHLPLLPVYIDMYLESPWGDQVKKRFLKGEDGKVLNPLIETAAALKKVWNSDEVRKFRSQYTDYVYDHVDPFCTAMMGIQTILHDITYFLKTLKSRLYVLRGIELTPTHLSDIEEFVDKLDALEQLLSVLPELRETKMMPWFDFVNIEPNGAFRAFNMYPQYQRVWYEMRMPITPPAEQVFSKFNVWEKPAQVLWDIKTWPIIYLDPVFIESDASNKFDPPHFYFTSDGKEMMQEFYEYKPIEKWSDAEYKKLNDIRSGQVPRSIKVMPALSSVLAGGQTEVVEWKHVLAPKKKGKKSSSQEEDAVATKKKTEYPAMLVISQKAVAGTIEAEGFHNERLIDIIEDTDWVKVKGEIMIPGSVTTYPTAMSKESMKKGKKAAYKAIVDRLRAFSNELLVSIDKRIKVKLRGRGGRTEVYPISWQIQ